MAEPGGICISGKVRDEIRDKPFYALTDLGEVEVKNISRPVHAFRVEIDGAAADPGDKTKAVAARASSAEGPRILVLLFDNLSCDPDQKYFSDGLTENLITELLRFSDLHVLARNTTLQYQGRGVDIRDVGCDLEVDFLLEGSVRRAAGRVRITAQLIDAASGDHVWAERYDRDMADVFVVQDEITSLIVSALASARGVVATTAGRQLVASKAPEDMAAYELVLRFRALEAGAWTKENFLSAQGLLERAIEIDPNYARAYTKMAR